MNTLNIFLDLNDGIKITNPKNINNINVKTIEDIENDDLIKKSFPDLKDKLLEDLDGIDLIINVTKDINKKTEEKNISYEKTFKPKKIIITNILMSVCFIMFLLTMVAGRGEIRNDILYLFGANFPPAIKANIINIYRLITCAFLHGSIIHLLCNMYALFVIGTQVETFLGKTKFLIIYIVSAITGSLMTFVFGSYLSIGASGAIFGLMGSLLYFGYHYRLYIGSAIKNQIIPIIILNLAFGFMLPGIDNFSHIGGLVGGYLSTMALGVNEKSTKQEKVNGTLVLILLWAFLLFIGFNVK